MNSSLAMKYLAIIAGVVAFLSVCQAIETTTSETEEAVPESSVTEVATENSSESATANSEESEEGASEKVTENATEGSGENSNGSTTEDAAESNEKNEITTESSSENNRATESETTEKGEEMPGQPHEHGKPGKHDKFVKPDHYGHGKSKKSDEKEHNFPKKHHYHPEKHNLDKPGGFQTHRRHLGPSTHSGSIEHPRQELYEGVNYHNDINGHKGKERLPESNGFTGRREEDGPFAHFRNPISLNAPRRQERLGSLGRSYNRRNVLSPGRQGGYSGSLIEGSFRHPGEFSRNIARPDLRRIRN